MALSTIQSFGIQSPAAMALSAATAAMAGPILDYSTARKRTAVNISNVEMIPAYLRGDTVALLKEFNDIIVTVSQEKPVHMLTKETQDYTAALKIVKAVTDLSPSISQTQWTREKN
jgi:hypothetical protein